MYKTITLPTEDIINRVNRNTLSLYTGEDRQKAEDAFMIAPREGWTVALVGIVGDRADVLKRYDEPDHSEAAGK